MTDTALIPMTALDRLKKTAERSNLDEFVNAHTRRSVLLVDCSSSMGDWIGDGERKIDKLRKVVDTLRTTHPVPMVSFPTIELVERIPDPHGMTPLHKAIEFARVQEANHIVLVTDGVADSPAAAFDAAAQFGGPIDVFYIGNGVDNGAKFCAELARRTGGQSGVTDLAGRAQAARRQDSAAARRRRPLMRHQPILATIPRGARGDGDAAHPHREVRRHLSTVPAHVPARHADPVGAQQRRDPRGCAGLRTRGGAAGDDRAA